MAKKVRTTVNRLKEIEKVTFNRGVDLENNFESTKNLNTLRVANQSFRVSMQSMRDQARYKAGGTQ